MSFNENHMINLGNYEEYFILYMDNELPANERLEVEAFAAQHPALAEELEMLMSTKLPLDEVSFTAKDELFSSAMKVATVDEALLLYIDNELASADKKNVEAKIAADSDYAQQHTTLLQTKLNPAERLLHPNEKELYRRSERVVVFKTWMRIAAAVVFLLCGSLFFLVNNNQPTSAPPVTAANKPQQKVSPVLETISQPAEDKLTLPEDLQQQSIASQHQNNIQQQPAEVIKPVKKETNSIADPVIDNANDLAQQTNRKREAVRFDVKRFTTVDIDPSVKETLAHNAVTSQHTNRITIEDTPIEPAVTEGDFKEPKRTSAKGLFRKVTRFIGRNTGIGTADIGEEVLIGTVALKLK